jgi:hypothetical protein
MRIPVPFQDVPKTLLTFPATPGHGVNQIPEGWRNLVGEILHFVTIMWNDSIKLTFKIEKGLLRFDIESDKTSEHDRKIINRICQSIASSSARICMECGKHGFRRKNEQGWPCLCTAHYIEYATKLTEQEND